MKYTLILASIFLFSSNAGAEDVCPEFANMVSVISEDGKSGKELKMERAVAKQKKKGIYRGYDNSVRLEGASAKVTVKSRQKFAFRPINPQVHPAQQIKLYPFQTKKDFRELVVGGVNTFGGSKNRKSGDNAILLERRENQGRLLRGVQHGAAASWRVCLQPGRPRLFGRRQRHLCRLRFDHAGSDLVRLLDQVALSAASACRLRWHRSRSAG